MADVQASVVEQVNLRTGESKWGVRVEVEGGETYWVPADEGEEQAHALLDSFEKEVVRGE